MKGGEREERGGERRGEERESIQNELLFYLFTLFMTGSCSSVRFVRHPMPIDQIPELSVLDEFIMTASRYLSKSFLLMDAEISTPRCQFGACILAIMCGFKSEPGYVEARATMCLYQAASI